MFPYRESIFVGAPGSGTSTPGRALAKKIGVLFGHMTHVARGSICRPGKNLLDALYEGFNRLTAGHQMAAIEYDGRH